MLTNPRLASRDPQSEPRAYAYGPCDEIQCRQRRDANGSGACTQKAIRQANICAFEERPQVPPTDAQRNAHNRRINNKRSAAACASVFMGWLGVISLSLVRLRRLPAPGDSSDHLVGAHQDRLRDRNSKGLGGLEVYDQLEPFNLLHGELARLGALE